MPICPGRIERNGLLELRNRPVPLILVKKQQSQVTAHRLIVRLEVKRFRIFLFRGREFLQALEGQARILVGFCVFRSLRQR